MTYKYGDLFQFEPVDSVIQLVAASKDENEKANLVKSFVFSEGAKRSFLDTIFPILQFRHPQPNQYGLMIVGNYGTGKSHMMSVISAIAENKDMVSYLTNDEVAEASTDVAGYFLVHRYEFGGVTVSFKEAMKQVLEEYMDSIGVDFEFDLNSAKPKQELERMMEAFQLKYPDKGFLLVIDEMLNFLAGKDNASLIADLETFRIFCETCANTRFRIIVGMQEKIFDNPQFKFAKDAVGRIQSRTSLVDIKKSDITFVVQQRLLKKTTAQKQIIRDYLTPFKKYYDSLSNNFEEFVNLFPVHPAFLTAFEKMRMLEKREVLKVVSSVMKEKINEELPAELDLLTIDKYWSMISSNKAFNVQDNVKEVNDCNITLKGKINSSAFKGRGKNIEFALKIVDALSAQRLEDSNLKSTIGLSAKDLRDNLCLYDPNIEEMGSSEPDEDLLTEIVVVLKQIIQSANGQYITKKAVFEGDEQYFIDIDKKVDYAQLIENKVQSLSTDNLDQYYYLLLTDLLQCNTSTSSFFGPNNLWPYELQWFSRRIYRKGWMFFGVPEERSTANPPLDFYLFFIPAYKKTKSYSNGKSDELIIKLTGRDEVFDSELKRYAAASALADISTSAQKQQYLSFRDDYKKKLNTWFENHRNSAFSIMHEGTEKTFSSWIKDVNLRAQSGLNSNEAFHGVKDYFNAVFSVLLDNCFETEAGALYPKFTDKLTEANSIIAFQKVQRAICNGVNYTVKAENDILNGLSLLDNNQLKPSLSPYANYIYQKLKEKESGVVLRSDEVMMTLHNEEYLNWDQARLEQPLVALIVLSLIASGDVVATVNSKEFDAIKVKSLETFKLEDIAHFTLSLPKDWNTRFLKSYVEYVEGDDLLLHSIQMNNDEAMKSVIINLENRENALAKWAHDYDDCITFFGNELKINIGSKTLKESIKDQKDFVSKLKNYKTVGKLKGLQNDYTSEIFDNYTYSWKKLQFIESTLASLKSLNTEYSSYFIQAKACLPEDDNWQSQYERLSSEISTYFSDWQGCENVDLRNLERNLKALKQAYIIAYGKYHTKARLDAKATNKVSAIRQSKIYLQLRELSKINTISSTAFSNYEKELDNVKPCPNLTDAELAMSPICPHCGYNAKQEGIYDSIVKLNQIEKGMENLLGQWTQSLLEEFEDPMTQQNLNLLSVQGKKCIETFIETKQLPDLNNEIIQYFNELLSGLIKKEVTSQDICKNLKIEAGTPVTIDQLRKNFDEMIETLSEGQDLSKIRIVLK